MTDSHLAHYSFEERPWGNFERFTLNEPTTVKIITVKPNEAFSLQKHEHRGEFWRILDGSARITDGAEHKEAKVGDQFFIPEGAEHRAEAGADGVRFLEISFGQFDENDIKRLADKYGRT